MMNLIQLLNKPSTHLSSYLCIDVSPLNNASIHPSIQGYLSIQIIIIRSLLSIHPIINTSNNHSSINERPIIIYPWFYPIKIFIRIAITQPSVYSSVDPVMNKSNHPKSNNHPYSHRCNPSNGWIKRQTIIRPYL